MIDVSPTISPVKNAERKIIGASKIARDITDRSNAAKYGSLSAADGDVEIAWCSTAGGWLSLRWTESGGPTIAPPTRQGFGTRITENIIGGQLGGKVRFDWRAPGLTCEIALLVA